MLLLFLLWTLQHYLSSSLFVGIILPIIVELKTQKCSDMYNASEKDRQLPF